MTVEELLALPEIRSIVRELVDEELEKIETDRCCRVRSRVTMSIGYLLRNWAESTGVQGEVHGGSVGSVLARDPEIVAELDVAWISEEQATADSDTTLIDGPPTLAVEVLSPPDTHQSISENVDLYLKCGVPLVWVVDPHFQTVTVFRPDQLPEQFNVEQELDGSPALPGFRCSVAAVFK